VLAGPRGCLSQKRRLTDAGLAAHHQRAPGRADAIDQILDERDLALAPQ
jgi:hypothetical protein